MVGPECVNGLFSTLTLLGLLTAGRFHCALAPRAPRRTGAILAISANCETSAVLWRGIISVTANPATLN